MNENQFDKFEDADQGKQASLLREVFDLLKHNKKYWMIPLLLGLLGLGLFIVWGGTAAAPFIYTLF